jgi:signal peptidase I
MSATMGDEPARGQRTRIVREIALTIGAVVGLMCILLAGAAVVLGITPLVLRSGSMEPTISTGALAIAKDVAANDIEPGDVISVDNSQGIRVTHRVESVDSIVGDAAAVTLKGDANGVSDPQPYVFTSVQRVVFHIDGLGYAVAWLKTPAAMVAGALLVAALIWITIFPTGRRRSPNPGSTPGPAKTRNTASVVSPFVVIGLATTIAIGFGNVHETSAAYTDPAIATTGSFKSKASFAPRIDSPVTPSIYVPCATSGGTFARVVTLSWKHVGAPYRYRVILRDLDGHVWRTMDVAAPSSVVGATVSATFGAIGFPVRGEFWDYDAEIHTMLPDGAVSSDWRGHRVYQDPYSAGHENLTCRGIQTSGSDRYIQPPASISCVTNLPSKTATVSWPHLVGYFYEITVRNPATGNIAYTANVVPPGGTLGGQPVSAPIGYSFAVTGTTATVEVRTKAYDGPQSTGFVSYQVTNSSANGATCVATGPSALRVAPTTTTPPPSTTTTTSPSPSQSTTTSPSPTSPSPTSPTTTSPATATATTAPTTTTTTTVPTTPAEQPLSPASNSSSGNYSAQLMQTATGPAVIIRDASGVETYRTPAASDDTLQWVTGADELRVTGSSGAWTISRTTGGWTKTPYVEAPATTSASTSP